MGMDTDARTTARRYYSAARRSLAADLAALGRNPQGVIVFTPRLVALLKPALSAAPQHWEQLADTPAGADAWYVHLLVGDLAMARRMAQMLTPQRWLCFQRGLRNPLPHVYRWQRILL